MAGHQNPYRSHHNRYPTATISGIDALYFRYQTLSAPLVMGVALSGIVAAMMLAFTRFGMFSWVDAKAIIHITVTVPMTPFAGWIVPSLSLSTLVNAGVIALIVPLVLLFWNLFRKKKRRFG